MGYRFRKGLVVGKFSPLHEGHIYLIRSALSDCEKLVIITYSYPEFPGCDPAEVKYWLESMFYAERDRITIIAPTVGRPHNKDPDSMHRKYCTNLLLDAGHTVDAVYTSETYGYGFAEYLTAEFQQLYGTEHTPAVKHICVDIIRHIFPVSGTAVRQSDVLTNLYVSDLVAASFVPRVAFLGGESSGKTTLVGAVLTALQPKYAVAATHEYGRVLYERTGGRLLFDDMLHIGQTQVNWERKVAIHARRSAMSFGKPAVVLCDTTPLTTMWYSEAWYNMHVDQELEELSYRKYDLTVLCKNDFEFVQDGTRVSPYFSQRAFEWYQEVLDIAKTKYIIVEGSVEERVEQVVQAIDAM